MMNYQKLDEYDVIVVGGGTAGVPAAIAAARGGAKTLLVEKRSSLGGVMTTGMPGGGFLDRQLNHVVGGIPQELVDRLYKQGESFGNLRCPMHNSISIMSPWWYRIVAAEVCQEAGVEILFNADLQDVRVVNAKVTSAIVLSGTQIYDIPCKVLIDASGDAIAAFAAGAGYDMGQPDDLNELVRKPQKDGTTGHGKVQPVSLMFCLGGVNTEKFKEYIREHPETYASPDNYGMKYDVDYLFNSPAIYFTGFGEFIEEARKNGEFDIPRDRVIFATMPMKDEYMINATRVINVDPTDPMAMSRAELECHRQIGMLAKFFKKYCPGFEESYISNIGPYTAARESRRVHGVKTVTKADIDALLIPEDCIALSGYNVDIHLAGKGLFFQPVDHAVGVPYHALVPRYIDGMIIAGRCISMDAYALGLLRSIPTCLAMGEAAGTAAAIAVKDGVDPRDVDVQKLRKTLLDNGAILDLPKK